MKDYRQRKFESQRRALPFCLCLANRTVAHGFKEEKDGEIDKWTNARKNNKAQVNSKSEMFKDRMTNQCGGERESDSAKGLLNRLLLCRGTPA